MIKRSGVTMYDGSPETISIEVYSHILSKAVILRGLFYDTKYDFCVVHKMGCAQFERAEHLPRYSLVGVYNRDTTPQDIQEDIEAL